MIERNLNQSGREFLDQNRQPVDPEVVRMYEDDDLETVENSPEFQELVGRIDFGSLRQFYSELARHTDIDPQKMNFIGPERIIEINDGPHGQYAVDRNLIEINFKAIRDLFPNDKESQTAMLFGIVNHEEGHAAAKTRCAGKLTPKKFSPSFVQSGYSQQVFPSERSGGIDAFNMFEEGVTEKLNRQLGRRYIDAHPELASAGALQRLREFYEDDNKAKGYDLAVSFVEAFVARLAHESGVSEETVWGAVIRGKFEGADFSDTDFAVLFSEMFGDQFLEKLSDINDQRDELRLVRLMDLDKLKNINPELRNRINKRIDAFSAYERKQKAA